MRNFRNNEKFVADVLYKAAVTEEKRWRKEKGNDEHDIAIVQQLINDLRNIGYEYKYFADITNRENNDRELLNIVMRYIGIFDDEGMSAELVGVVGKKGNTEATQVILKNYMNSSEKNKRMQAGFYDNALEQIKDKRYLSEYLELLKNPEDAVKLHFTTVMLGKWQIEEAKPYFLNYLNSTLLYLNDSTSDLVFTSLEALSYYKDLDGTILKAIESKLYSSDKNVVVAAKKAMKRLMKNSKKCNMYAELHLVFDNDFDVNEITNILQITPTECKCRKETRISPITNKNIEGFWTLKSNEIEEWDVKIVLEDLTSMFIKKLSEIKMICEQNDGFVIFDIVPSFSSDKTPAIYFERDFLDIVNYLDATIQIDMYVN